jgi:hypothetical protein
MTRNLFQPVVPNLNFPPAGGRIPAMRKEGKKMSSDDESKKIKATLNEVEMRNLVLKAKLIMEDVRILRIGLGEKEKDITKVLDGIEKDLNGLVEKYKGTLD